MAIRATNRGGISAAIPITISASGCRQGLPLPVPPNACFSMTGHPVRHVTEHIILWRPPLISLPSRIAACEWRVQVGATAGHPSVGNVLALLFDKISGGSHSHPSNGNRQ